MDKEERFHELHHNGKLLLLPNIWDAIGGKLLEKLGYPAVATSSSAIAMSNGYQDGEKMPFEDVLNILKTIARSVNIPVTADVERLYAGGRKDLIKDHVKRLIDMGIAGINYEDSFHGKPGLADLGTQQKEIESIREAAQEAGSTLFINARVDVYIRCRDLNDDQKLAEAIKRGKAYKESGADGLYPIILKNKKHISRIVSEVGLPVNITYVPGVPEMPELEKMGVARVTLASGFIKPAIGAMRYTAEKLLRGDSIKEVMEGWVDSEFLESL